MLFSANYTINLAFNKKQCHVGCRYLPTCFCTYLPLLASNVVVDIYSAFSQNFLNMRLWLKWYELIKGNQTFTRVTMGSSFTMSVGMHLQLCVLTYAVEFSIGTLEAQSSEDFEQERMYNQINFNCSLRRKLGNSLHTPSFS